MELRIRILKGESLYLTCFMLSIAFCSNLAYAKQGAAVATAPRLRVSSTTHNFGEVWPGQKLTCDFELYNDGNGDLRIIKQKTTCGCTMANPIKGVIPPGTKKDLKIGFAAGRRPGKMAKKIFLEVNDPEKPIWEFTVTANVVAVFEVTPSTVDFGDLCVGTKISREVQIKRNKGKGPLDIKKVTIDRPGLTVKTIEQTKQGCKVAVTFHPERATELLLEKIDLVPSDKKLPPIDIQIKARVHSNFFVSPNRAFFGFARPGLVITKSVTVGTPKDDAFAQFVLPKKLEAKDLEVSLKPDGENRQRIDLTWKPTEESSNFHYRLPVKLVSKKGITETIDVLCLGLIKKK